MVNARKTLAPKRGNPLTGDGPAPRKAFDKGEAKRHAAVKVTAHFRKHPERVKDPEGARKMLGVRMGVGKEADNAFAEAPMDMAAAGPQAVTGLNGEPQVNHLKAAIGLMNRRKA